MNGKQKTYPIGEEKINSPESILRVGKSRAEKIAGMVFPGFSKEASEALIQNEALLVVSKVFMNDITFWRNNTGAVVDDGRLIRFGIPGQADTSGLIKPFGTRLEIEFKRKGKKQSEAQKNFQKMIESFGGIYLLCDGDIMNQIIKPLHEYLCLMEGKVR